MPRRRSKTEEPEQEITAWPSSAPEDVGSFAPSGSDLAVDYEDLGSRFLSDAVEQSYSERPVWYEEHDDAALDPHLGSHLLRSFGLRSGGRSASVRPPLGHRVLERNSLAAPRLPEEYETYLAESGEIDLTEENVREASLLDHETD